MCREKVSLLFLVSLEIEFDKYAKKMADWITVHKENKCGKPQSPTHKLYLSL